MDVNEELAMGLIKSHHTFFYEADTQEHTKNVDNDLQIMHKTYTKEQQITIP